MKNIKKLLKEQGAAVLPDKNLKQKIKYDGGMCEEETFAINNSGAAVAVKRRGVISALAIIAAVAVGVSAVALWFKFNNKSASSPIQQLTEFGSITSATDFYAYGAVSVGGMLDFYDEETISVVSMPLSLTVSAASADLPDLSECPITEEQKNIIDKYAVFATGVLGSGQISSVCRSADKSGYEYMLDVGYSDGFGGGADRTLYFNKVEEKSNKENEFAIAGELITGDSSYPVEGKYETKVKNDETQSEIEFKAFTSADRKSYIRMEYEYESSAEETENEFVISVFSGGELVERAEISGETEKDKTSFGLEVFRADGNIVKLEFTSSERYEEPVMQVKAFFGDDEREFMMRTNSKENGGGYEYFYDKFEPEHENYGDYGVYGEDFDDERQFEPEND